MISKGRKKKWQWTHGDSDTLQMDFSIATILVKYPTLKTGRARLMYP